MPRPNLQDSIKRGVLSPNQLATLVGLSCPTIRRMCLENKIRHSMKPGSRGEIEIAANLAILDLTEEKFFSLRHIPPELILAARFYIANRQDTAHPVPDHQIPPECNS